jgi:phage baseplate assembly protein W|tara:strand:+ start:394 stop:762 length:369 start_codon:yes stop_codon:yes gene_type:complete
MASYGVALPLVKDSSDGFRMLKDIRKVFQQNLKMLLLTVPGERVMDPQYGVGVKTFLFQNYHEGTGPEIETAIRKQTAIYMPRIQIDRLEFQIADIDKNTIAFSIVYSLPYFGITDLLEFTI